MASKFFPVSINLNNKNILVIGAGKIAFKKVKILLNYNCKIRVVTKDVKEREFFLLQENNQILLEENRIFHEKDLKDVFLVVAATSDASLNKNIAQICLTKNILVNNITSKEEMSVRFASIYEANDFQVAVSAQGNPKTAKEIRNKIKKFLEKIR